MVTRAKCDKHSNMSIIIQKEVIDEKSAFVWIIGTKDHVYLSKSDCLRLAKELVSIAEEIE